MPKTILITGATGNISSGIIAQLKGSEHSLRALLRNPAKTEELRRQGVEIYVGDLEKPWNLMAKSSTLSQNVTRWQRQPFMS